MQLEFVASSKNIVNMRDLFYRFPSFQFQYGLGFRFSVCVCFPNRNYNLIACNISIENAARELWNGEGKPNYKSDPFHRKIT